MKSQTETQTIEIWDEKNGALIKIELIKKYNIEEIEAVKKLFSPIQFNGQRLKNLHSCTRVIYTEP